MMRNAENAPSLCSAFGAALLIISISISSFALKADFEPQNRNPDSNLSLSSEPDGFNGTFNLEDKHYGIENKVSKGFFNTLISRPDGSSLIASSLKDDVISLSLPTGRFAVNTVSPLKFSAAEVKAVREFIRSDDAAVVRRIVYEVRNRRLVEKRPLLSGFRAIAMLLGDGDVKIASAEKNVDRTKLTFKLANYTCNEKPTNGTTKVPTCSSGNCCGCCGPGCWGCSGCYTDECLAHDLCVDEFGYTADLCMALLPFAVASVRKCGSEEFEM